MTYAAYTPDAWDELLEELLVAEEDLAEILEPTPDKDLWETVDDDLPF